MLAPVEELWFESSFDGRKIQGWVAKPPAFDASKTYPLILEIHGGPFANYGEFLNKLAEMEAMIQYGSVVLGVAPDGPNPQDMPNLGYRLNQN